jgi:hypothetical protein
MVYVLQDVKKKYLIICAYTPQKKLYRDGHYNLYSEENINSQERGNKGEMEKIRENNRI